MDRTKIIFGDFGPFFGRFGVTLGSLWDDFGIVLGLFWGCLDNVLALFSGLFGVLLTLSGGIWAIVGHKRGDLFFLGFDQKSCRDPKTLFRRGHLWLDPCRSQVKRTRIAGDMARSWWQKKAFFT